MKFSCLGVLAMQVGAMTGVSHAAPNPPAAAPLSAAVSEKVAAPVPTPSCEYGCEEYRLDALICINHEQYRCATERLWSKTGKRCE